MLALFLAALESNEDKQVFIKIYEQHLPLMERTATRILKEQSDSEDAVQNAFVQIIRHFDKIHKIPREELPFWIISIVTLALLLLLIPQMSHSLSQMLLVQLLTMFSYMLVLPEVVIA